jgi:alkylation response protein AidB-like acyl-CoA dehydrogenase
MEVEESLIIANIKERGKKFYENSFKIDQERIFPKENLELFASQGYFGAFIPKPYSLGLDYKVYVEVVKGISKAYASTAWIYVTHCAASYSLNACAPSRENGFARCKARGSNCFPERELIAARNGEIILFI